MMKEEEIRQKVGELETYRAQLDTLAKQDEILRLNIEELIRVRDTVEGIREKKSGEKILVPIGANFFIHAKLDETEKVISNVGSNVAAEETIKDATDRLDKHIKELSDAGQELAKKVSELESISMTLTQQLQEEYAKLEEKKDK
jgi:prefoldin alpha subunit